MTILKEFFNRHESDVAKGITHKNNLIKRNIIAYMALNGESTLADLSKQLHISIPTITKLVGELVAEDIVTDNGKVETPRDGGPIFSGWPIRPSILWGWTSAGTAYILWLPT